MSKDSVKVQVHIRLESSVEKLGRRMAKEDYGHENKLGMVCNEALKHYYAYRLKPTEVGSLLTNTEQFLINRIEKQISDMTDRTINRIGDLYARTAFESCLNSLILEEWMREKHGDLAQHETDKLRKKARYRMSGRLEKNGAEETAQIIEENYHLKIENQKLKQEINKLQPLADSSQEKDDALQWLQNLIVFLTQQEPDIVTDLIRQYDRTHERPKGL